ncbi:hypothetical protein Tco_1520267 [Tanacetum coccineum]
MFQSLILRRIRRRMTTRTLRRILSIILPTDDEDDDVDIEADDDEEEEVHPAPADSTAVALPAADQALSAEETEPFKTDESAATPPPHPAYRVTTRISIPAPIPTPVWSDVEVARLLAISTPPSSLLSPGHHHCSVLSPVPVLSPSPPASPIHSLAYQAAMIRLRAEAASTSHSLPLPSPIILFRTIPDAPSSGTPPLHLLSTDRREDIPEVTLLLKRGPAGGLTADYGFVATMDREIRCDLERDVRYGITDSWDEIVEAISQEAEAVYRGTEADKESSDSDDRVRDIAGDRQRSCTARCTKGGW